MTAELCKARAGRTIMKASFERRAGSFEGGLDSYHLGLILSTRTIVRDLVKAPKPAVKKPKPRDGDDVDFLEDSCCSGASGGSGPLAM